MPCIEDVLALVQDEQVQEFYAAGRGRLYVKKLTNAARIKLMAAKPDDEDDEAKALGWSSEVVAACLCDKDGGLYCNSASDADKLPSDLYDESVRAALRINGWSEDAEGKSDDAPS